MIKVLYHICNVFLFLIYWGFFGSVFHSTWIGLGVAVLLCVLQHFVHKAFNTVEVTDE